MRIPAAVAGQEETSIEFLRFFTTVHWRIRSGSIVTSSAAISVHHAQRFRRPAKSGIGNALVAKHQHMVLEVGTMNALYYFLPGW